MRSMLQPMLMLLVAALPFGAAAADPKIIATFSVAAFDPATGEVGVAVQSKFFAVGSVVPWCQAGVGAVATQAFGQPAYGPRGLALLQEGYSPDQVLEILLLNDEQSEQRQIGIVGAQQAGFAASYTGSECLAWAGGRSAVTAGGIVYCVQGNILASEAVLQGMAEGFEAPAKLDQGLLTERQRQAIEDDSLAARLLAALLGGQLAGGDARGMQSAALKVCQAGAGYGGYSDVKFDLRVDDAADPFDELARLLNLAQPIARTHEAYRLLYAGEHAAAAGLFTELIAAEPANASSHYHLACALSLGGNPESALAALRVALELDPKLLPAARTDPDLAALRELPETERLLAEAS